MKLAETFGAQGFRATAHEELRTATRLDFDTDGPTDVEIPVGEMPGPWRQIRLSQVCGKPKSVPDWLPPLKAR